MIPESFVTVLLSGLLLMAVTAPLAAPAAQAAPASTLVVDDSSDVAACSGFLTLRCAIVAANAAPCTNIRFAPGLPAVLLNSPLPTITGNGTWIDGHDLSNGCVCPRLDGAFWNGATGNALTISANDVTISNMNIVGIPLGGADISISFGTWSFTLPAGVTALDITLTAFNLAGDSSEMSPRPQLLFPLISR